MAASHCAYNTLKMLGPMGVISIPSDKRDVVLYVDMMYRNVIAAEAIKASAPAKEEKKVKKTGESTDKDPEKHSSSKGAPGSDLPESSACKRSKAAPPTTKKVSARHEGTYSTFTISETLDDK